MYVGIYLLCVANITSQYYAFVLVELVCILKYKLNKSYLCLTRGQFLSSLIQPLSTSENHGCGRVFASWDKDDLRFYHESWFLPL